MKSIYTETILIFYTMSKVCIQKMQKNNNYVIIIYLILENNGLCLWGQKYIR